jgi:hypothetical protein
MKTKGGKAMNPADAFRKEQRRKEVARNKLERRYVRDAGSKKETPNELKKELQELLDAEEGGTMNKAMRLRKKAITDAFDKALKAKRARFCALAFPVLLFAAARSALPPPPLAAAARGAAAARTPHA